jgi:hypothetical protein
MRECVCMKKILRESVIVILAVFSTVALFVDVESTGNLSMALNGDGIPQLIALVLLIWAYRKVDFRLNRREKIWYGILAVLFSLFMIIGKAQSKHPDLKYTYLAVVLFMGYFPLFYTVISYVGKKFDVITCNGELNTPGKVTRWLFEEHVIIGIMLVVFLFRLPYLIAFYPCSMTWDGGAQICSFYGIEPFTDHHPPLLSFVYGLIAWYSSKWNIPNVGMFMIPLITTLISAFTVAKTMELFKYLKVPYWVRWSSIAYYAVFTVWCISDVTVIKDSLYYPFTMLFVIQVVYCIMNMDEFFAVKHNLVLMFAYGLMVMQIRNNGVFVLVFLLPIVFILVSKKNKVYIGGVIIALIIISYLLNNIVYPSLGVTNIVAKEDTYCIMFQQTAKYGQDHPDDVTEDEREFLDTLFDYDELVKVYNPHLADWVKNCLKICEANSADNTNSEFLAVRSQYFKVWFAQFLRHPLCYIDTFFQCSYGYYYPEVKPYKEGVGNYEMDRNMFTEGMHAARQIEKLAPARFALEQLSKLEYVPGVGLLYRCGFYTWCVLLAVVYYIAKKQYINIVFAIPAMVNILVCLISPVNTCMRYALPTMCMVPILYALIFMKIDKTEY